MPLPYHQSEALFRRYEPAITKIVAAFPHIVIFQPDEKQHQTFVARLRNLKASLAANRFTPTTVDMEKFDKIGVANIIVADLNKKVVCGSALAIKNHREGKTLDIPTEVIAPTIISGELDCTNSNIVEVKFLAFLASKRALTVAVKISIDDTMATTLLNDFDINLEKNDDGTYTLT